MVSSPVFLERAATALKGCLKDLLETAVGAEMDEGPAMVEDCERWRKT